MIVSKWWNAKMTGCSHMISAWQLRLPWLDVGLYGPAWGYRQFFPQYSDGIYALNDNTSLVVSRGLARESTPLPRFFNHPEVMVLEVASAPQ